MNIRILCLLLAASQMAPCADTAVDPTQLTLARIFTDKEFQEEKLEALHWSKLGAHYFALEEVEKDKTDDAKADKDKDDEKKPDKNLARYDAATGAKTIVVSAQAMIPKGAKKPLNVDGFEFSKDESQVLLFANTK
ncbi:MAG: hypothetical protein B7Z55_10540, partial [Planctomycetales bacterium 12-60-4]